MPSVLRNIPTDSVYTRVDSPVGELWLIASDRGLHAILWQEDADEQAETAARLRKDPAHPILKKTAAQLREYFAGRRTEFDIKLAPEGTPFQKQVWLELRKIPYGRTISYGEQARRLGDAKKARAVGTANSRNPISIIVPCHRVIANNGDLSGFGGGVDKKRFLLDLETQLLQPRFAGL
jgi:methylated-DNA-[protein]-cysteine S-methyltransferase